MKIPLLGEDVSSWLNTRKREINAEIKSVCKSTGLSCIDPEPDLEQIIVADRRKLESDHYFFPALESPDLFTIDADFIEGNPVNADFLSAEWGLSVTVDGLHLNSSGASIVAKKINVFLANILVKHQL